MPLLRLFSPAGADFLLVSSVHVGFKSSFSPVYVGKMWWSSHQVIAGWLSKVKVEVGDTCSVKGLKFNQ